MASAVDSSRDSGNQPTPSVVLSDYEQARARKIEKHNAKLRSLGLITVAEERRSNDMAWGRHTVPSEDDSSDDESSDEEYIEEGGKRRSKKEKKRALKVPREGSRKSRRLRGENAEGGALDDNYHERLERVEKERKAWVAECREARQRAAIEVAKAGAEMTKNNPTASYAHCLMRVKTMTEKGLKNRVSGDVVYFMPTYFLYFNFVHMRYTTLSAYFV